MPILGGYLHLFKDLCMFIIFDKFYRGTFIPGDMSILKSRVVIHLPTWWKGVLKKRNKLRTSFNNDPLGNFQFIWSSLVHELNG